LTKNYGFEKHRNGEYETVDLRINNLNNNNNKSVKGF
jgi:hypothetical protein